MCDYTFIAVVLANTKQYKNGAHWQTLLGERPAGSRWGRPFVEDDFYSLAWEECTEQLSSDIRRPGVRYFKALSRRLFPDATMGAIPLGEALSLGYKVRVVQGVHGLELQADSFQPESTGVATLIVGQVDGKDVIFTSYPGSPLASLPKDVSLDVDLSTLNIMTAVKLV